MTQTLSDSVYLGLDLSPTHYALVGVDGKGAFVGGHMATMAKVAKKIQRDRVTSTVIPPLPKHAPLIAKLVRLDTIKFDLISALHRIADLYPHGSVKYLSIEDYAYRNAHQAHQIGETSGVCRLALVYAGCRIRLYSPSSIKQYATGSGGTEVTKAAVCAAMLARGAHVLGGDRAAAADTDEHGDFYDAYTAALMTLDEVRLRAGIVTLQELSDARRSAFIKTDKTGNNVLVQPWAFLPEAQ